VRIVERLGATGKRAAFAKQELGSAYRRQGDLAKAARAMAASIADFERLYGPDSHDVAFVRLSLALVLFDELRLQEAEEQFRAAIAIQEKYPSLRTQAVVFYRLQLAMLLMGRGRYAEAYSEMDSIEAVRKDAKDTFPLSPRQVQVLRGLARLAQGDVGRGLAEMQAAATDPGAFIRRTMVSTSVLHEFLARGYLLAGDIPRARAAVDTARAIAVKEGTSPVRNLWIALREAEVTAGEGQPDAGLEAVVAAAQKYAVAASSSEARLQIALVRARIQLTAGRTADALATLEPWLDRPLDPGVELPAAARAEMLLLAGEALAAAASPAARRRLLEAQAALKINDVAASPRLTRVHANLARLPG
jgi:tetratricopeptide (TPR) repeat protein